jgi:glycerol uptake facilitator-like aquaporin
VLNPAQTFGNYLLAGNYKENLEMMLFCSAAQYIGGFIGVAISLASAKAPVHPSYEIDAKEWLDSVGSVFPRSYLCLGDCRWMQTFITHLLVCSLFYFCCLLNRLPET